LELLEDMEQFQEMIRALRNLRVEAGLAPQQPAPAIVIATEDLRIRHSVEKNRDLISLLGRVEEIRLVEPGERPKQSLAAVLPRRTLFLGVGDILDVPSEMERLRKEKEKIEEDIAKGEKKLENESFLAKAPEDVVVKERERLREARERLSRVIQNLESLAS
jgi:valyl-tRNA synthetase